MQPPSFDRHSWRELRRLCVEMTTILVASPAKTCCNGLHQLVRDAMKTVLALGVGYPFDWSIATRKKTQADHAGWFKDFPELADLETLTFQGPPGSTQRVIIILDARDGAGERIGPLLYRGKWAEARRHVLSILRHWIQTADDRLSMLAAPPEPAHNATPELAPRISVDLAKGTVTLDGQTDDVRSVNALRWVKVLADHAGEWISSTALKEYDAELDGSRTDRLKPSLPEAVRALIDSDNGKGSRLRL